MSGPLDPSITQTVREVELEQADRLAAVLLAERWQSHCRRCGRPLFLPRSVVARIGPTCAARETASGQLPIPERTASDAQPYVR